MECKFCDNFISYRKDKMLFHSRYWYDGNGWNGVPMCSKAHPWVKALFAQFGGLVPPLLNDMEVPTHISNGWIEDVTIKTSIPLMEGEFALTSQMEGAQIFTPPTNNT